MKKLIIAEKPSVAADLAKALGKFKKFDDRYEGEEYVVSWAVGHLVELVMPEDIDESLKRWSLTTLPIVPKKFKTKPIEKTKKRLNELKKLIQRDDVESLINGCDAGREGELIFTYIYEQTKCKKPFQRLWLSSMTLQGIKDAFQCLRDSSDMQNLQDAAKCRSEADWLIGINGTRAITSKIFSFASKQAATVGRVQTPTLAMIVNRDRDIANFVPKTFWKINGRFSITNGEYDGILQKSDKLDATNEHDRVDRFWSQEDAEKILLDLQGIKIAEIKEQKKRSRQSAPRLYDLTTLQREANTRYGMPANMTLSIAQSLYERHKCLTYPRTDSRALTEDYVDTCYKILAAVNDEHRVFAQEIIQKHSIDGSNRKIFNNKQVSDHFAIVPTQQPPKNLKDEEWKIFSMVLKRFICVFFPDAEFDITTRLTTAKDYVFKTEGKVLVNPGWMAVYGKSDNENNRTLPAVVEVDGTPPQANIIDIKMSDDVTRPPAPYNEATLLAAMEGAGKLLEDDDLVEAMKERGLGTPATRAQIIEHLLSLNYLVREKKDLRATAKAENLLNFLKSANIETLSSPAMTGEWEYKLRKMESGEFARTTFMQEISTLTEAIVDKVKQFTETGVTTSMISPTDGQPLLEMIKDYKSQDGKFKINKIIGGRKISEEEVVTLLKDKRVGPLSGFKSKTGAEFSATLVLDDNMNVVFEFDNEYSESMSGPTLSKEEIDQLEVIGVCPFCKSEVVMSDNAYVCKNYFDKKCKLRISKKMLERDIPVDQMQKLLIDKTTDMLDNFRSKRTGKLFSAKLVLQKEAKIKFEFK